MDRQAELPYASVSTIAPWRDGGNALYLSYRSISTGEPPSRHSVPILSISDGTAGGTVRLVDLPIGMYPGVLITHGAVALFVLSPTISLEIDPQLWSSDGTAAGTRLELDLAAAAAGSSPTDLTLVDDRLFFIADDGVSGWQLWVMDPVTPTLSGPE